MDNLDSRIREAIELIEKEQYQDAAEVLEEVRAANPNHHDALFLLGCIYAEKLDKVDKGRELLERRIKLYPQEGDAYYVLAELELRAGNCRRALGLYEQAVSLGTEAAEGHYNAGICCRRLAVQAHEEGRESEAGDFMDKAFEHWTDAVRLAPLLPPARVNLGACYLNLGEYKEAIKHFNEALRVVPEDRDAWMGKLEAYSRMGDFLGLQHTARDMLEFASFPASLESALRNIEDHAKELVAAKNMDSDSATSMLQALRNRLNDLKVELPDGSSFEIEGNKLRFVFQQQQAAMKDRYKAPPDAIKFPHVPGLKWELITMRFRDGHTIMVVNPRPVRTYHYSQMGFTDRTTKGPIAQWQDLWDLADNDGVFRWGGPKVLPKLKKRKQRLANLLKSFFGLDDNPFYASRKHKGWVARFRIYRQVCPRDMSPMSQ